MRGIMNSLFLLVLLCVSAALTTDARQEKRDNGWFGIALLGQSNIKYTTDTAHYYNPVSMQSHRPSITNPNCVFVGLTGDKVAFERNITNTTVQARQINLGVAVLAEWLGYAKPSMKFNIKDMSWSGTTRAQHQDDRNISDGRVAAHFNNVANWKTNQWGEVDVVIEFWTAGDGPTIARFGSEWSPLYLGQLWNGTKFQLGNVNPNTVRKENKDRTVDNCFWDIEANANQKGRCLWARAKTKWAPIINSLDSYGSDIGMRAFHSDPRVQTFASGTILGDWSYHFNTGHAPINDVDGVVLASWHYVPPVAQALGFSIYQPQEYRLVTASDGSYADIFIKLPNGGKLTTIRKNQNRAPATNPLTWQQEVVGVEIRRVGTTQEQRQPVFLPSTNTPNNFKGTVVLHNEGSGTGANREGVVRVTPVVPFVNGDILYLNWLGEKMTPGYTYGGSNYDNAPQKIFLDRLVETVPSITFPQQKHQFPGIPIRSFMPILTVSRAAPTSSTTAKATSTSTTGSATTGKASTSGAATTKAATSTTAKVSTSTTTGGAPVGSTPPARAWIQSVATSRFVTLDATDQTLILASAGSSFGSASLFTFHTNSFNGHSIRSVDTVKYVMAANAGASPLVCIKANARDWESFTLVNDGSSWAIWAFINQKYVDVLSTFELQATLTTASVSSSKFNFLTPVSDLTTATTVHLIAKISSSFISVNSSKFANAINSSLPLATTFAINRLANGNYTLQNIASSLYATAEQDFTSTPLVADRPVVKNWEQFFITKITTYEYTIRAINGKYFVAQSNKMITATGATTGAIPESALFYFVHA